MRGSGVLLSIVIINVIIIITIFISFAFHNDHGNVSCHEHRITARVQEY